MSAPDVLVTGGAGFIGSHLCAALVAAGRRVRVLDNFASGHRENLAPLGGAVELVEGDVCDPAACAAACAGVREIFHEAALVSVFDSVERPEANHAINLTGTLRVLEAARAAGVRRVVLASSAAVYGNDPALPKVETMRPQPESPYALGKLTGEYYLRLYAAFYGVQTVSLRYFNVYGPRQDPRSPYSGVISRFADCVRAGRAPTIYGDGLQSRDFVFVGDVVQANLRAMAAPALGRGEVFNIASGRTTTLLELLATLGELSGRALTPELQPARAGDIRHSSADIAAARAALGYAPAYDLRAGLRELLEYRA